MPEDKFVKYGGMKFVQKASAKKINQFVGKMTEEERKSMHQVVNELEDAQLIDLKNEVTTIDDEMIEWQETNIGKE
ncbi:MAG: hypothetical protein VR72_10770 [Clostridiaceae bacterium BRH_c20a]|nr:MAG: hypothetical protein VR72_10770 [Clostridiaceae bacterium BRH_c20a]